MSEDFDMRRGACDQPVSLTSFWFRASPFCWKFRSIVPHLSLIINICWHHDLWLTNVLNKTPVDSYEKQSTVIH